MVQAPRAPVAAQGVYASMAVRRGELAQADAAGEIFRILRHRLFAVGGDEFVQGGRDRCVGEAGGLNPRKDRFREGFRHETARGAARERSARFS